MQEVPLPPMVGTVEGEKTPKAWLAFINKERKVNGNKWSIY